MGEDKDHCFKFSFTDKVKTYFKGSKITSDGGLVAISVNTKPRLDLLIIPVIIYISVIIHEMGHFIVYKIMGRQVIAFGLGIANPIIKFKIGETIFFLCAKKPLFGQTYIIRSKTIYSKGREIIGLSGGILAELILGGIFYLMFLTFKVEIFLDCTFVIFILLIVFPILVKLNIYKPYVDGKSDMTRIIEAMRNKDSSQHIDSNVTINLFNELNVEIDKYVPKG